MDGMGRGLFIYYGKRNYYVLINCIRHCSRGEFIQNYFKIFSFSLIWDKNLRSYTGSKTPLDTSLPFYFSLFIFLSLFSEKFQHYRHDFKKALLTNSCVMDLNVKQATALAKNSSI